MNRISIAYAGIFALLLSACSVLPSRPPTPAVHDFGLGSNVSAQPVSAIWANIKVDAPEWLQSENIRYRLLYAEPTRVRFYAQDRWIAPPPALLAQRLSLYGGGKGYSLNLKLMEFEQVFDGPQQAHLILVFRATAYRPGEEVAVAEKLFRFDRPTSSADAQGAVTAAHVVVEEAIHALQNWLNASESSQ